MNFSRIQQYAWYLPEPDIDPWLSIHPVLATLPHKRRVLTLGHNYASVSFGWEFVHHMAMNGKPLPPILDDQDMALHRAYWFIRTGHKPSMDPVMKGVLALRYCDEFRMQKNTIHGYMVCKLTGQHQTYHQLSEMLGGVSLEVLETYEKLFFNIKDRLDDTAFIRNLVYPTGRMVEYNPEYRMLETEEKLMMRAAYNNGLRMLLHLAGARDWFDKDGSAAEFAKKCEAYTMAQCLTLQGIGMGGAREIPYIRAAHGMIQSSKMGGGIDDTGGQYVTSIGELLMDSLHTVKRDIMSGMQRAKGVTASKPYA